MTNEQLKKANTLLHLIEDAKERCSKLSQMETVFSIYGGTKIAQVMVTVPTLLSPLFLDELRHYYNSSLEELEKKLSEL